MSRLSATAYHEAGHAVAAYFLRVPFRYVTIVPDADAAGHIRYLCPVRGMKQTHDRAVVALAGEQAQRRHNPGSVRRHQGSGDRQAVLEFALAQGSSPAIAQALVELWSIRAAEMVATRWESVERLATALLERKRLSAAEAASAIMRPGSGV